MPWPEGRSGKSGRRTARLPEWLQSGPDKRASAEVDVVPREAVQATLRAGKETSRDRKWRIGGPDRR